MYGLGAAVSLIRNVYRDNNRLVWGVSGFASPGFGCRDQVRTMQATYAYLVKDGHRRPSLVVDGAAAVGVLGANGVIAEKYHIPRLGYSPRQGLSSMGPRDHMVVHRDTYRGREALVGITPDLLACFDGGEGTHREARRTIDEGSVVFMALHGDPHPKLNLPDLQRRATLGRLIVWDGKKSPERLEAKLQEAIDAARQCSLPMRPVRLRALQGELSD
jgi:hypothetical protein